MSNQSEGEPRSPLDNIRSLDDIERIMQEQQDELMRLAFTGKIFGFSTPETDATLAGIAINQARNVGSLEKARRSEKESTRPAGPTKQLG
jgi:hypothetical protein